MQNERLAYERILEQPARRQVRHHRGHNHHASPTFILAGDVVPRYDSRCVRRDAPERTDPQPNPLRCDPGPPLQRDLRLAHAAPDSYPLALIIMLVGLTILFLGLFLIMGISIARFSGDIASYTGKLNVKVGNLQELAKSLGLSNVDIRDAVKPSALTGAISTVLSGVAAFLSNLFLILLYVLFFLAERPAMMNRLRNSAGSDHPQFVRLTVFGRNVVRQLGLRAIVNLVTGAGVTVLLLVLRVDFPLMWGILAFFLSFIPWIGLPLAVAPAVVLALAEHGI